jgi:hypothetical protein
MKSLSAVISLYEAHGIKTRTWKLQGLILALLSAVIVMVALFGFSSEASANYTGRGQLVICSGNGASGTQLDGSVTFNNTTYKPGEEVKATIRVVLSSDTLCSGDGGYPVAYEGSGTYSVNIPGAGWVSVPCALSYSAGTGSGSKTCTKEDVSFKAPTSTGTYSTTDTGTFTAKAIGEGSYGVQSSTRIASTYSVVATSSGSTSNTTSPTNTTTTTTSNSCGSASDVTVVGRNTGVVWGSGPYGATSDIGTAAVHAGLIQIGQTATIHITPVGVLSSFQSSLRNSVLSYTYIQQMCAINISLVSVALTQNLLPGSTGSEVTLLQQKLVSLGYLTNAEVTGYFGPITEAAVQKFQCDKGIVCSGTPETTGYGAVGPATRTALNAATSSSTTTTTNTSTTQTPTTLTLPPFPVIPSPLPTDTEELKKLIIALQEYVNALAKIIKTLFVATTPTTSTAAPTTPITQPSTSTAVGCKVTGCSNQLCVDASSPDIMTTCEWKSEYTCYANARCERQASGICAWTETTALQMCLEANASGTAL